MTFRNNLFITALSLLVLTTACAQNNNNQTEADLESQIDSVSYALGFQYGKFMAQQNLNNLNTDALIAGLNTGLNDGEGQLTDVESQQVIQDYQRNLMQKEGEENLQAGKEFLEQNLKNEGVVETESGLQYKVLEEGDGASPTADDVVRVHYEGRLINGDVFDSSYQRGEPAEFPLSGVIRGWTEGVQLMKEGAKYEFYIPGNLAYGENPRPGSPFGPNETLIFTVELLEVVDSE